MTNDTADGATKTAGRESSWENMSVRSKATFVLSHCTVEPMMAFFIVASLLTYNATNDLNLQKACRVNLRMDKGTCWALKTQQHINGSKEAEVIVQKTLGTASVWKSVVQNGGPLLMIVFIGSWSDRKRMRKPCMLVPLVGRFLASFGLFLCTYFFNELPMEVSMLAEAVPEALFGSWTVFFMAVYSYIGDVSTIKMRTFRIGIVNAIASASVPIGSSLCGLVYSNLGHYGVYSMAMVMYSMGFVYGLFYIKETKPETSVERKESLPVTSSLCLDFFKDFFRLDHIREGFQVTFRKGQRNRRLQVILMMFVFMAVSGPFYGEMEVGYMFTRVRFNWEVTDYSWFTTFQAVATLTGTSFVVIVLNHMLQIDDALIGFIACVSNVLAAFVYAFATAGFVFYLAPVVDIVNGTGFIASRSIISKFVWPNDIGKINSVFGICEGLVPLLYMPIYRSVYTATLETMPGFFYLMGAGITVIAGLIFSWLYFEHKKDYLEKVVATRDEEAKTDVKQGKNCSVDDPKTVLEKGTQTGQMSIRIHPLGFDNKTFQMEEEFCTRL